MCKCPTFEHPAACTLHVLWGQPINLIQVTSNSELHENQQNDLLFFEIVPSHSFGALEVQGIPAFRDFTIRDPLYFVILFQ